MSAAVKTPISPEEQDEAYNPGDEHANDLFERQSSAKDLQKREDAKAFDDIAKNYDQTADPSAEDANIKKAKDAEENPDEIPYNGGDGDKGEKEKMTYKGYLKKAGPAGAITSLLFAGLGGLSLLFSPGLAIVHFKELLTDDLNDQLAAMDTRSFHVFKAKLKGDLQKSKSICATGAKIRCGFKGMSQRQIKKFEKAGIKVEKGSRNPVSRNYKIESLTFKDSAGKDIVINDVKDLNKLQADRAVRDQIRRAYNPKFAGFYDKVSAKIFAKFKTGKTDKLTGKTDKDKDKNVKDTVAGRGADTEINDRVTSSDPEDDAKNKQADADNDKTAKDVKDEKKGFKGISGSIKSSSGLKAALKGVGILGAYDTACTVYKTMRAVGAAAKVVRAAQLAAYAMIFLTFADQVKAGKATEDQANYVGNKLTEINLETKTVNENSKYTSGGGLSEIDNPRYGKSAFDSAGYRTAAYNESPDLDSRSQRYMVGGGLVGTFAKLTSIVGKGISTKACNFVQSPIVRGVSLVIGIFGGIFSGGSSLALSVGASMAAAMVLPYLQAYLTDMVAGNTVGDDTRNTDVGDASFSGTAVIQGETAAARGIEPLATVDQVESYSKLTKSIQSEYVAMETEDAKKTPFDIYNQYSFLGSLARKVLPATIQAQGSLSGAIASSFSIFGIAIGSTLPTANAVGDFNPDRFKKCSDPAYEKIGIKAADIFCNVRYGMSGNELNMDTDEAIDKMLAQGHIDEEGTPISEDYKKWIEECTNRQEGWGEVGEGATAGDGKRCLGNTDQLRLFRVYFLDRTIIDSMEYDGEGVCSATPSLTTTVGEGGAPPEDYSRGTFNGGTFNKRTVFMLEDAQKRAGLHFRVTRPGYNANLGHERGNGIDIGLAEYGSGSASAKKIVKSLREAGFAAWERGPRSFDGFDPHIHAVTIGDKDPGGTSDFANAQVKSYFAGRNGLGNGSGTGPDRHLEEIGRPVPEWAKAFGEGKDGGDGGADSAIGAGNCPAAGSEADGEEGVWVWPIKGKGKGDISQGWGEPNPGRGGPHKGIDLPVSGGTPILAAHNGVVKYSKNIGAGCGWGYVISANGTDYYSGYQHLNAGSLKVGDTVKAGQEIGTLANVGGYVSTSCSTGAHLHFSVEKRPQLSFYRDSLSFSINPLEVLP